MSAHQVAHQFMTNGLRQHRPHCGPKTVPLDMTLLLFQRIPRPSPAAARQGGRV